MEQELFNWLLSGFGVLLGFIIKVIWDEIKSLKSADKQIAEKIASIEVLVAGNYVTRDELNRNMTMLSNKLDGISAKLDAKADRK